MIRKFFGQGDLFVYAVSNTELQGTTYNKGDMIAYFQAVGLSLEYNIEHKQGASDKRQISHTEQEPNSLNVGAVPNTSEVDKIFFKEGPTEEVEYSTVRTYANVENTIYLKEKQSPFKVKMFSNGIEVPVLSIDEETNTIEVDGFYKSIDVISYFKHTGEKRTFDKPELGYVELRAVIQGKFGDEDGTFVLHIPLADLVSEPVMDLTEQSNYHVSLSFALINAARNEPTVVHIRD